MTGTDFVPARAQSQAEVTTRMEKRWMSFPFAFIEHSQEIDQLFDELIYRPYPGGVGKTR